MWCARKSRQNRRVNRKLTQPGGGRMAGIGPIGRIGLMGIALHKQRSNLAPTALQSSAATETARASTATADSLAPPPGCDFFGYLPRISPRFARLNTGLRTAATPPGCPARSASNGVADCVPCDADLASLPMGTNAASLRCRFVLSGLCGVALPFHDVKVRFKFRGY